MFPIHNEHLYDKYIIKIWTKRNESWSIPPIPWSLCLWLLWAWAQKTWLVWQFWMRTINLCPYVECVPKETLFNLLVSFDFTSFSVFLFFPIADMKETQAAIIETSKYPVRFFHHDFSHILKIILSTDFVEKKGYMYLLLLSYY